MRVKDLSKFGFQEDIIKKFEAEKIDQLYPPQEKAINAGLLEGKNLILSVPTAAGKTFVATAAAVNKLQGRHVKAVYIVPLVALANEKYEYYKKLFKGKWKVGMSVGDMDSSNPKLTEYDFIVCTTEKLDSLIRHRARWVNEIDLVIIDEIHLLNDPSRGPTLEILITQLKEIIPKAQFLGLSATIKNSDELAEWMDATLVQSDFRPVKLYEGVSTAGRVKFFDKEDFDISNVETERSIIENTIDLKKQAIFFVSSRRNAESLAQTLANPVKNKLTKNEISALSIVSDNILNALESPTRQCRKLADCVKNGSAFHHAGLVRTQKRLIEENFRKGIIKSISATPTLAMGVNLPAFRVVVRDVKRYYRGLGSTYIPVLEYKQIVGRAGRPQYDEYGESILFARSENEADKLAERFIMGEPEKIISKLAMEPVLRMHVLALISNGSAETDVALMDFFSKTFYAHQYGDMSSLWEKLEAIIEMLTSWEFITKISGKFLPTKIGKRVSELYIDPLTAHGFISSLEEAESEIHMFGLLHVIANTIEMRPLLSVRSREFADINEALAEREHMLLQRTPRQWDFGFDDYMRSIKTAMLFEAWTNEKVEDDILREFKVAPGELRWRLSNADWLIYSLQELALLLGMKDQLNDIRKARMLLKYGVKEELLPLVRLRTIGRVRGRMLFKSNIKTLSDLKKIPIESLSKIIGAGIAYNIKEQLGEDVQRPEHLKKAKQVALDDF